MDVGQRHFAILVCSCFLSIDFKVFSGTLIFSKRCFVFELMVDSGLGAGFLSKYILVVTFCIVVQGAKVLLLELAGQFSLEELGVEIALFW